MKELYERTTSKNARVRIIVCKNQGEVMATFYVKTVRITYTKVIEVMAMKHEVQFAIEVGFFWSTFEEDSLMVN